MYTFHNYLLKPQGVTQRYMELCARHTWHCWVNPGMPGWPVCGTYVIQRTPFVCYARLAVPHWLRSPWPLASMCHAKTVYAYIHVHGALKSASMADGASHSLCRLCTRSTHTWQAAIIPAPSVLRNILLYCAVTERHPQLTPFD